ncbi:response regulator [Tellurirhabdus rosea]|uniref:response regulator n=1 Tax=Tellurirhabdus rosea TaxID=2674997 RepID=UPI002255B4BD|nr:response regulator transcription factor [Tellurirhabdus rosea]
MAIPIALVDDNSSLLRSIGTNLRAFSEVELLFTATDGASAVSLARQHRPQVILMDIEMPIMDGIAATAAVRTELPGCKVIMLTVFDRDDKLFEAIKAGASGYLLKDERPYRLVQAIEEVLDGGAPMSPGIALKTLELLRRQRIEDGPGPRRLETCLPLKAYDLTNREEEILELLVEGLSPAQIGDRLFISPATVRKHIENCYQKLHVHSRLEAIRLAERNRFFG